MYCSHCGKQIADDAMFCSQCGTRVADAPRGQASGVEVPSGAYYPQPQQPQPQQPQPQLTFSFSIDFPLNAANVPDQCR